jgi:hypothetical protein
LEHGSRVSQLELSKSLCERVRAAIDDLREAVTTLEDIERIARRVLGGAHPATESIGSNLREVRAELRAREAQSGKA